MSHKPEGKDNMDTSAKTPAWRPRVAGIMPLIWQPEKANFRRAWELLSDYFEGAVFTLSEPGQNGKQIGAFRFIAASGTGLRAKLGRLWVQTIGVLAHAFRHGRFDVVVVYDPYASGLAGCLVAWLMRARLIVEMNGDYHEVEPPGSFLKRRLMRRVMHQVLRRANAVRVLNESQERFIRSRYPSSRVYRFADFTPVDLFLSLKPWDGDYFLFVGYPFHLKGVDLLIRAFKLIHGDFPQLGLRIMGHCPPPEDAPFRALAEGCPAITFVPPAWIEDVAREMSGAVALVNPARTEAMGRVHLEAMASAKPVVASATNGAREILDPGNTGLLVELNDVKGLAEALRWIASNRTEAREMGERGREVIRERFQEEAYRENVTQMIWETLGSPAHQPG